MAAILVNEICERFRAIYLPVVCDALYELGIPEQILSTGLRPLFPEKRIVGHAFTVQGAAIDPVISWDEGKVRIASYLRAFELLQPDNVIVSTNPLSSCGHFGELTGNSALERGCTGVILDGNLRDTSGLRDIGLQVFYRDLSPLNGIGRWEMVSCQEKIKIDGIEISPGDIVIAEFDGVLIVPREHAETVLLKSEEIAGIELLVRTDMRNGFSPLEGLARHGHI